MTMIIGIDLPFSHCHHFLFFFRLEICHQCRMKWIKPASQGRIFFLVGGGRCGGFSLFFSGVFARSFIVSLYP
jgi:hypothetical protein